MTGRVPLSSFYQANLDGQWRFSESDHYLRQLGALDEDMSAGGAHVIIPNYVLSPNNCMGSTDHFTVCCRNECESFMDELEAAVGAPEASSDVLVDLVLDIAAIHSDSEPEVSVALRQQLKKIEGRNGGLVPLHGKLFAQWLHYMFPHECPFPRAANSVVAMTPDVYGSAFAASRSMMEEHVSRQPDISSPTKDDWFSLWSDDEELLTEYSTSDGGLSFTGVLSTLVIIVALIGYCLLRVDTNNFKDGYEVAGVSLPRASKAHLV